LRRLFHRADRERVRAGAAAGGRGRANPTTLRRAMRIGALSPGEQRSGRRPREVHRGGQRSRLQRLRGEADPCGGLTPGTLALGAECHESSQCAGGSCSSFLPEPDGGRATCGVCVAPAALGAHCGTPTLGGCGRNAECLGGYNSPPTCVALTFGAQGAACNIAGVGCLPGLYCDASSQCAPAQAAGSSCQQDQDCASPLICNVSGLTGGVGVCATPRGVGANCGGYDVDCGPGLGCNQQTYQCEVVTWVAQGGACDGNARCLVGLCANAAGQYAPNRPGTCPTVLADGALCTGELAETCDTYADCIDGACTTATPSCSK
jgi:hypothetical protein